MEKVIIIKYGELNTKKDNINYFIKALRNDLSKKIDNDVEYDHGRMIIFGDDLDIVKDALNKTFGIHEYEIGYKLETNNIDIISIEPFRKYSFQERNGWGERFDGRSLSIIL